MNSRDEYARDRDGRILTDRFGRPVRRRPAPGPASNATSSTPGPGPTPAPPRYVRSNIPDAAGQRPSPAPGPERGRHERLQRPERSERAEGLHRPERTQRPEPPRYRQAPSAETPQPGHRREGYAPRPAAAPQQGAYRPARPEAQPRGAYQQPPRPATARPEGYRQYPQPAGGAGRGADWGGPGRQPQRMDPGRGRPRRAGSPRRPRRRLGIRRALLLLLALFLVIGSGTLLWADSQLQRTEALQNYEGRVGGTAGTNWLLVGSDSRAGLDQETADRLSAGMLDESEGRTDSIILVHLPLVGKATMISLPRDSFVNIPGYGENKINAAFALGGPALLQRTVEEATGLRIDHYAEVGFGGFANAVDGVGGVEMCLEEPLEDPMAGINLPAGCQKLDGPNALGYVRSRYTSAGGDLDRAGRQRQLLAALSKKMLSPGTLFNPFRLFPTVGGVAKSLTVDKGDHMWHLARLGVKMRGAKQEVVPTSGSADNYAGSVLLWDQAAAEQLFSSLR
ncbi:LCP family protein [Corynebacterium urealyticum]|uniref:Putative transcriptional regulator (LytR family) n=1 Tax=Corynebacterium urealyticum (strain ATCC 43042 / DSM 7109) TaxID=504474 RepID=B1VE97_CORU7|nr:LCP family protein [Corynebacterium urealyticum]QQC42376.1 LCP family protein [Corynebacterium urealyticum]QQE51007.1 LCP family protein [Corynebacterium urealyticum]CAQ04086.1 putative transcriptional regulator (LytR family) [Corynebacterium urealyticum DSM 7109]